LVTKEGDEGHLRMVELVRNAQSRSAAIANSLVDEEFADSEKPDTFFTRRGSIARPIDLLYIDGPNSISQLKKLSPASLTKLKKFTADGAPFLKSYRGVREVTAPLTPQTLISPTRYSRNAPKAIEGMVESTEELDSFEELGDSSELGTARHAHSILENVIELWSRKRRSSQQKPAVNEAKSTQPKVSRYLQRNKSRIITPAPKKSPRSSRTGSWVKDGRSKNAAILNTSSLITDAQTKALDPPPSNPTEEGGQQSGVDSTSTEHPNRSTISNNSTGEPGWNSKFESQGSIFSQSQKTASSVLSSIFPDYEQVPSNNSDQIVVEDFDSDDDSWKVSDSVLNLPLKEFEDHRAYSPSSAAASFILKHQLKFSAAKISLSEICSQDDNYFILPSTAMNVCTRPLYQTLLRRRKTRYRKKEISTPVHQNSIRELHGTMKKIQDIAVKLCVQKHATNKKAELDVYDYGSLDYLTNPTPEQAMKEIMPRLDKRTIERALLPPDNLLKYISGSGRKPGAFDMTEKPIRSLRNSSRRRRPNKSIPREVQMTASASTDRTSVKLPRDKANMYNHVRSRIGTSWTAEERRLQQALADTLSQERLSRTGKKPRRAQTEEEMESEENASIINEKLLLQLAKRKEKQMLMESLNRHKFLNPIELGTTHTSSTKHTAIKERQSKQHIKINPTRSSAPNLHSVSDLR
jgi:tRNA threonylcarbamoyladenosine modification (KEOPS) complex  Pcc1 subunit